LDWSKILTPTGTGYRMEVLEALAQNQKIRTMERAKRILDQLRKTPDMRENPLAFFQYGRVLDDLPEQLMLPAKQRLAIWADTASQQLASYQVFGPRMQEYFAISSDLSKVAPLQDVEYISNIVRTVLGYGPSSGPVDQF